jgi:hypothetical protein
MSLLTLILAVHLLPNTRFCFLSFLTLPTLLYFTLPYQAPEPSNILFANLKYPVNEKVLRRIGSFFLTLLTVAISAVVVYFAQEYQRGIQVGSSQADNIIISCLCYQTLIHSLFFPLFLTSPHSLFLPSCPSFLPFLTSPYQDTEAECPWSPVTAAQAVTTTDLNSCFCANQGLSKSFSGDGVVDCDRW